ncbi:hypothetical protein GCM10023350_34960 [Nocardioides endophyticus]|uniref:Uncharacterized protein n=1 Tax=Nocardioides endophyticus TaxID=1353775 RepID=A0ABP8Z652_9ACTN
MTHAALDQRKQPADPKATAEVRALSHVRALTDLFGRRPDLTGVYTPADLTNEAVLWSA